MTSACNGFCEVGGSGTGVIGAEGLFGLAQQAGVEQCVKSQPLQQQFFALPAEAKFERAAELKAPCQARTKLSRRTRAAFKLCVVTVWLPFGCHYLIARHPLSRK